MFACMHKCNCFSGSIHFKYAIQQWCNEEYFRVEEYRLFDVGFLIVTLGKKAEFMGEPGPNLVIPMQFKRYNLTKHFVYYLPLTKDKYLSG